MKRLLSLFLLLALTLAAIPASAQSRRPIDSRHPLWMIHVDVWNQADPQRIIDMIPKDIRPFVCMNLSLSCQYDTDLNVYKMPQNGVETFKAWATVCQHNGMWFTCQPASGGHTHIQDSDLDTFEYFFKTYPNFLGWNYAEQFWGFDEQSDKSSSSQASRIALFAKLVEMSHRYGGFLTISFCGNMWSHGLSPLGMLKRDNNLLTACEKYPDAILWLYKYTQSGCYYNSESTTWGPFVAGLANNYGVRYDNCGWKADMEILGGKDKCTYPLCAGVSTVMEQTCVNGGAVWDGPETIPTECINRENDTQGADGYMHHNWTFFPGFKNVWIDMWRKVIDGTLYIPTREEILGKTKIAVINDLTSGSDEDKYASWQDLYDNVYKQDDPYNQKEGQYKTGDGDFMNNLTWFKKTGRYGAIPIVPELYDNLAKAIPVQVKKSARWATSRDKIRTFNEQYPEVSTGDLYVNRFRNQLITYTPYSYFNSKQTASATVPLQYNTCKDLQLTWGKLSTGAIREYADHISFYLNNYRTDTIAPVTDKIIITGATSKPSYSFTYGTETVDHVAAANDPTATVTDSWDAAEGTYTLEVSHCSSVNLTVNCQGSETGRKTDYLPNTKLETPKQPETYSGPVILQAEDMDYRNIQECCLNPYYTHQSERGHVGNGYVILGNNNQGSLEYTFSAAAAGTCKLTLRYMNTDKDANIKITVNGTAKKVGLAKTDDNEWKTVNLGFTLKEGDNTIVIDNVNGIKACLDEVTLAPTSETVTDDKSFDETPEVPSDQVYDYVVYQDNFAEKGDGWIPEGWLVANGDDMVQPGQHGSGPRIFQLADGSTFTYGMYVRTPSSTTGYALYGAQEGDELSLKKDALYNLSLDAAAWKKTPYLKVEVLDMENNAIASKIVACQPDLNGSKAKVFTGATHVSLGFSVPSDGNYLLKFSPVANEQGDGAYWLETLIGNIKFTTNVPTGIHPIFSRNSKTPRVYDLSGRRISRDAKGLLIVDGMKVIKK